jgi:phosphoglycolate phosphatase-like HAD superfamily hydrolase
MNGKTKGMLIFDFDGVMVDNTRSGLIKIQECLQKIGLDPFSGNTMEEVRKNWGAKTDDLLTLAYRQAGGRDGQMAEFMEIFKQDDTERTKSYPSNGHLMKAVQSLQKFGFITGLISNRQMKSLTSTCWLMNFDLSVFNYIQVVDHHPFNKPDGRVFDPMLTIAAQQGIVSDKIAYFGDTILFDYAAVKNNGAPIKFVAVASGANTVEEFKAVGISEQHIIPGHDKMENFLSGIIEGRNLKMSDD